MISRRGLLLAGGAFAGLSALGIAARSEDAGTGEFPFQLTDAEWRERLTDIEYQILRRHGTERAFTSPLDGFYEPGLYSCAGCGHPLYDSDAKYDSRTGWPSFWEALPGAIGTSTDTSFFMVRTECHCANCGGHLGHIFEDGPPPTGKRHCINGVALRFEARPA